MESKIQVSDLMHQLARYFKQLIREKISDLKRLTHTISWPSSRSTPTPKLASANPQQAPTIESNGQKLLSGKTALITGGGKNIGRAIALEMAQQGANIIVVDIDPVACDRLQVDMQAMNVNHHAFTLDITHAPSLENLVQILRDEGLQIDILVNNLGITPKQIGLKGLAGDQFREIFDINILSPMALTHEIANMMIKNGILGTILFITSMHQSVLSRSIPYSSSKAALAMAIKELAIELSGHNIRVNGIAPGWVSEDEAGNPKPHPYTPLRGTSINPCYIGRAAVYLASDYFSRFTTGTILKIDAGLSLYGYRIVQHPPESHP